VVLDETTFELDGSTTVCLEGEDAGEREEGVVASKGAERMGV
jgi:hypothetical protein